MWSWLFNFIWYIKCPSLGFVDCGTTSKSTDFVLDDLVRLEYVETLDLSNNKIGIDHHFSSCGRVIFSQLRL